TALISGDSPCSTVGSELIALARYNSGFRAIVASGLCPARCRIDLRALSFASLNFMDSSSGCGIAVLDEDIVTIPGIGGYPLCVVRRSNTRTESAEAPA